MASCGELWTNCGTLLAYISGVVHKVRKYDVQIKLTDFMDDFVWKVVEVDAYSPPQAVMYFWRFKLPNLRQAQGMVKSVEIVNIIDREAFK